MNTYPHKKEKHFYRQINFLDFSFSKSKMKCLLYFDFGFDLVKFNPELRGVMVCDSGNRGVSNIILE